MKSNLKIEKWTLKIEKLHYCQKLLGDEKFIRRN